MTRSKNRRWKLEMKPKTLDRWFPVAGFWNEAEAQARLQHILATDPNPNVDLRVCTADTPVLASQSD